MTAVRLEQYRELKREIRMLEESIRRLAEDALMPTSDAVHGSMPEYPYVKCVVKITGMDARTLERLERRKFKLSQQREMVRAEVEEIEAWVGTIEDSRMRQIVTLRFVDGHSWRQVARRIGGGNTEDGVRMAFARFIEKSESCSVCSVLS